MLRRCWPYIAMACVCIATNILAPISHVEAETPPRPQFIEATPEAPALELPRSEIAIEPDEFDHINPTIPAQEIKPPEFYRGKWIRGEYLDDGVLVQGWWVPVIATAYSPMDDLTRDDESNPLRKTSKGVKTTKVKYGIAIPPERLPYGCEIIVPKGNHYENDRGGVKFTADDTGPIIRDNTRRTGTIHIDLRYWSVRDAFNYNKGQGRKKFCVFVIDQDSKYAKFSRK